MKVIVVEDEVLVRLMLADVLREHGFDVLEAANAAEALSILRSIPVDVAILDLHMKVAGEGMLVANYVRRQGLCTLLVLASAQVPRETEGLPFDAFFIKPYDPEEIAIWIKRRSVTAPGQTRWLRA